MVRSQKLLTGLVAAALAALSGNAAVVTFGPVASSGSLSSTVSLPQFNPNLGTLNSVTINFQARETPTGSFENTSSTPIPSLDITYSANIKLDLIASVFPPLNVAITSVTPTITQHFLNIPGFDGSFDLKGPSSISFTEASAYASGQTTLRPGDAGFSAMTGPNNLTFYMAVTSSSTSASSQNGIYPSGSLASVFDAKTTITYDYTPVPEPGVVAATLLLVGAGLVSRAVRRRDGREP